MPELLDGTGQVQTLRLRYDVLGILDNAAPRSARPDRLQSLHDDLCLRTRRALGSWTSSLTHRSFSRWGYPISRS